MRVVVLGEGNTDVTVDDWSLRRGALRVFVQRILGAHLGRRIEDSEIRGDRLPRLNSGGGYPRKVRAAIDLHSGECNLLVIVVDRDGHTERLRLLQLGRDDAEVTGNPLAAFTVVGIAQEMIEAWLLADPAALSSILQTRGAESSPEDLPDPKSRLDELIDSARRAVGETYDELAKRADLQTIRDRCGHFDRLADEIKSRTKAR